MNLYNLHTNPSDLAHHDVADTSVPVLFWDKYEKDHVELKRREAAIAKYPKYAYRYAMNILKGPFKAGEAVIAKDPRYAHLYARDVLKGPFKAGEAAIAKSRHYSGLYAENVLKHDFYLDRKV